ncbi:MAG: nucleotide exchange factor GrpE [Proteobacteria bacterium]|nr:nucleotide exchange factor GrpE [Pseudomonadota bacterium]
MTDMEKNDPELEITKEGELSTETKEEELSAEVDKLKDQLLRTVAELENYRKRAEREREETAKYAISAFARELLTVSDNLRRAIESVPDELDHPEKLLKTLLEGIEITEKELLFAFKKHGIERIDPLGQAFDHHLHQAMFEVEDTDKPVGTVVHVLQPGYQLSGRLLRPAMVGVAKGKNSEPTL